MANILLLDDSDVAGRAMQGILARGSHACFVAKTPDEAWRILREGVVFDLVFAEVKLSGAATTAFLQRLREDWFWKILPVVVYTFETDAKLVRKALGLRVQNYLIKPYNDELIFNEIAKATKNPWRNLHFEEPKSFCSLTGMSMDTLTIMRREVMTGYDRAAQTFPLWAEDRQNEEVFAQINELATNAENAGVWAGVDFLRDLLDQAAVGNWAVFRDCGEPLEFASRMIFCQLNPSYAPDCMRSEDGRLGIERVAGLEDNAEVDQRVAAIDRHHGADFRRRERRIRHEADRLTVIPAPKHAVVFRPDRFEPVRKLIRRLQAHLPRFPRSKLIRPLAQHRPAMRAEPQQVTVVPVGRAVAVDLRRHRNEAGGSHSGLLRAQLRPGEHAETR